MFRTCKEALFRVTTQWHRLTMHEILCMNANDRPRKSCLWCFGILVFRVFCHGLAVENILAQIYNFQKEKDWITQIAKDLKSYLFSDPPWCFRCSPSSAVFSFSEGPRYRLVQHKMGDRLSLYKLLYSLLTSTTDPLDGCPLQGFCHSAL